MTQQAFPKADMDWVTNYVFEAFDINADGFIDFKEFMIVLYIMSAGTPEENLGKIFQIFDKNKDGSITQVEMVKLVKDLGSFFQTPCEDKNDADDQEIQKLFRGNSKKNVALMAFKEMDKDSDGRVTKEEFISACYQEKSISNLFALKIIDIFIAK